MAVEWKTDHTRSSVYFFAPEDIVIKPELNGRHDLPDVTGLIEDILKRGQLEPVLVRNDGGKPVLVAGFSRWRAISEINQAGKAPVKLKIACAIFRGNEQGALLANISENNFRNSTTPIDDAHNIARLERYGLSMAEIASVYRQTEHWCRQRLEYVNLSVEAQAAMKEGRLKPTAAAAIAKLSQEQQRATVAKQGKIRVADAAIANGKPKKPGARELKQVLSSAADKGELPEPLSKLTVTPDIQDFCASLIEWMSGKLQETA